MLWVFRTFITRAPNTRWYAGNDSDRGVNDDGDDNDDTVRFYMPSPLGMCDPAAATLNRDVDAVGDRRDDVVFCMRTQRLSVCFSALGASVQVMIFLCKVVFMMLQLRCG